VRDELRRNFFKVAYCDKSFDISPVPHLFSSNARNLPESGKQWKTSVNPYK